MMWDWIRDHFYCVVHIANRNDGAIQAFFAGMLVVLAVLAWWVARRQSFTSVMPVVVVVARRLSDDPHTEWDIAAQNSGLGPALNVDVKWAAAPGEDRSELGIDIAFPAIEPGGSRFLFMRTAGVGRDNNETGASPQQLSTQRVLGAATVTYNDVHGRGGRVTANLVINLRKMDTKDDQPIRWLTVETVANRPPGFG